MGTEGAIARPIGLGPGYGLGYATGELRSVHWGMCWNGPVPLSKNRHKTLCSNALVAIKDLLKLFIDGFKR